MAKAVVRTHAGVRYVYYHCPGCSRLHCVPADQWNWSGDAERPTLSPSVRHFIPADDDRPEKTLCHYFVRDGRIEFCADSAHALAGQAVDLVEPTGVPDDS